MYGFLITTGNPPKDVSLDNPQHLEANGVYFYYSPMPKFENDKLFYTDGQKTVLLDGVVFNKKELMEDRGCKSWRETVDQLIREDPKTFQKELRGSFCGALLEGSVLELFTNQSGEKTIYYTQEESLFSAASHNNILTAYLKEQNIPVMPDLQAHRELLATGSILHGGSPFQGVRRLTAGKYLLAEDGRCEELRYHMFHNVPEHDLTLEECVEELDKRFRKAVDRIFSKNEEYGYQGECDLSGGLDSRMATWVAHDLGYRNILNVCYCQSGNIDHTISRKIAHDLGNEYFFLPMDGGELLTDVDESVDKIGGQVSYILSTGANRAIKQINMDKIGLTCMGLWGEAIKADKTEGSDHTPPNHTSRYSSVVNFHLPEDYKKEYNTYEQMNFYEYGAPFILSSMIIRQQVCEAFSPNVDVDYLEFIYKTPLRYRKNYLLLKTWVVTKYPEAAKYVWQTERMPVDKSYHHQFYFPKLAEDAYRFVLRCFNKVGRIFNLPMQFTLPEEMNPFDQWYCTNRTLRQFLQNYYQENIGRVADAQLQADVRKTYEQGGARDKLQAVNLLAVYKRYF